MREDGDDDDGDSDDSNDDGVVDVDDVDDDGDDVGDNDNDIDDGGGDDDVVVAYGYCLYCRHHMVVISIIMTIFLSLITLFSCRLVLSMQQAHLHDQLPSWTARSAEEYRM